MNQKVIVFSNENGVAVMHPADCGLTIIEVGQKDVPEGVEFWIIDSDELHDTPQSTWELDHDQMGSPAGYGGTYSPGEENE